MSTSSRYRRIASDTGLGNFTPTPTDGIPWRERLSAVAPPSFAPLAPRFVFRRRGERIFRPRMLRITRSQRVSHLRIRVGPEACQIIRDLLRPPVRREQMQEPADASAGNARRVAQAK